MTKEIKSKAKSNGPVQRTKCDLLGDVHRLCYDSDRKRMVASVLLSPTDMERLLKTMKGFYSGSKTKRGKRIVELAEELAKLVMQDCQFFVEGTAYVATGNAVRLSNDSDYLLSNIQQNSTVNPAKE